VFGVGEDRKVEHGCDVEESAGGLVQSVAARGIRNFRLEHHGLSHAKKGLAHAALRPNVTRCATVWRDTDFGVHGNDMAQFSFYECANDAQNLHARSPMWQAGSLVQ
jgi:hypothetical protein